MYGAQSLSSQVSIPTADTTSGRPHDSDRRAWRRTPSISAAAASRTASVSSSTRDDYVHDVAALFSLVKSREPGKPVFLLGHSAGGVVACLYALEHQRELAGLICESFAHEVPAPDFALAVFKGVSHVAPHARILHLKNELFSRDAAVVRAMNEDPLIAHETQATKTMAAMVRADERLKKEFPNITLPVLILHGTADQATKPSGSQHFYDSAGSTDKTLKLYEGHYHDLLNDVGKETVMAEILAWISAREAGRAVGL